MDTCVRISLVIFCVFRWCFGFRFYFGEFLGGRRDGRRCLVIFIMVYSEGGVGFEVFVIVIAEVVRGVDVVVVGIEVGLDAVFVVI